MARFQEWIAIPRDVELATIATITARRVPSSRQRFARTPNVWTRSNLEVGIGTPLHKIWWPTPTAQRARDRTRTCRAGASPKRAVPVWDRLRAERHKLWLYYGPTPGCDTSRRRSGCERILPTSTSTRPLHDMGAHSLLEGDTGPLTDTRLVAGARPRSEYSAIHVRSIRHPRRRRTTSPEDPVNPGTLETETRALVRGSGTRRLRKFWTGDHASSGSHTGVEPTTCPDAVATDLAITGIAVLGELRGVRQQVVTIWFPERVDRGQFAGTSTKAGSGSGQDR